MTRHFCIFGLALSLAACGSAFEASSVRATGPNVSHMVNGKVLRQVTSLARSVVAVVADDDKLCTGSVLNDETILTAAHCLDGVKKAVIVFAPKLQGVSPSEVRLVDRSILHPDWNRTKATGDLAIARFKGGLPEEYEAVELSEVQVERGAAVRMLGYGVSDPEDEQGGGVLRETQSKVIDFTPDHKLVVDERKSGACFGDSGGPAFMQDGNDWVQIGVTHSGLGPDCDEASEYTSVAAYFGWIHAATHRIASHPITDF